MTWQLITGDCVEVMRGMESASIDAVVTDPPYHLSFMGKDWDRKDDHRPWADQALRVLKPGGHLLSFGGTRTYHWLVCALEDAGFEIRDCLAWLYGSGFPKSLDVSKAIDKAAGAAREERNGEGEHDGTVDFGMKNRCPDCGRPYFSGNPCTCPRRDRVAATPDAERWQGWGTALKPAFEPIVLARKPLAGTVAENVLEHGVGALNVDGTRIETDDNTTRPHGYFGGSMAMEGGASPGGGRDGSPLGRWPANVLLDVEAAAALDEQSGDRRGGGAVLPHERETVKGFASKEALAFDGFADSGGASRFFYTAKTSRSERENGVREYGDMEERKRDDVYGDGLNTATKLDPKLHTAAGVAARPLVRNNHPTVKPVDLMQWLCRLITPPQGLILDPFTGSGSTGIAALREGFSFVGIERELDYVEIARARIIGDAPLFNVGAEA